MKKSEIMIGGVYVAKVSNKLTRVRVDAIREYDPSFGFNRLRPTYTQTRYDVTNLTTGRRTTFRSAAKFRYPNPPGGVIGRTLDAVAEGGAA